MTFLYPQNRSLIVMDSHFNIYKSMQVSDPRTELDNM